MPTSACCRKARPSSQPLASPGTAGGPPASSRGTASGGADAGGAARAPGGGFTLLELLVVLAIIALLGAVALPSMSRLYDSATRATERERILDQFAALGAEAMRDNRNYAVFGTDADARPLGDEGFVPYPLTVPDGWQVTIDQPILVRANGVCAGGRVTLRHPDSPPIDLDLVPPFCRVPDDA